MTKKIEITNKRICAFYAANPTINIETVNIVMLDLFEKFMTDNSNDINSRIFAHINENSEEIKTSIASLKDTMLSIQAESRENVLSKIMDVKKEYIEEVRRIVDTTNVSDKISSLLDKNNNILIDKTSHIINEVVPKTQTVHYSQIQDSLHAFHKTIAEDTKNIQKSIDSSSVKEFINNFEIKTSIMLQNLQQPIYSFISASEDRINTNINNAKDANQTKIMKDIGEFIGRFHGDENMSSGGGGQTGFGNQSSHNNKMSSVLTKIYNSAEISKQNPGGATENSGTILLKRLRKPNILIENKDSPENISVDDVNAFLSLIDEYNCNGIFISQHSGISTKKNYQIEINANNNIVVFLHAVEYCSFKIESAVDIIDNLTQKFRHLKGMSSTSTNDDVFIPKDVLDGINTEYQLFMNQRNAVIDVFKESQKKVLAQIDELRFPCLDKFLSTRYSAPIQKPGLKCELCKSFTANNLKALAAHKRGCSRKNAITTLVNNATNITTTSVL